MRRRDFLRGLLGCAVPAALLPGAVAVQPRPEPPARVKGTGALITVPVESEWASGEVIDMRGKPLTHEDFRRAFAALARNWPRRP